MKGEFLLVTCRKRRKRNTNLYKAVSNVFINPTYMDLLNLTKLCFFSLFLKNVFMHCSLRLNLYLTSKYDYGTFYAIPYRSSPNEAVLFHIGDI